MIVATPKTAAISKSPTETVIQEFDTSEWCLSRNTALKEWATSITPSITGGLKIAGVERSGDVLALTLTGGRSGDIYIGTISIVGENKASTTFDFTTRIRGTSRDQVSTDDGIVVVLPVISIAPATTSENAPFSGSVVTFSSPTLDEVKLNVTAVTSTAGFTDFELPVQFSFDGQSWEIGPDVVVPIGTERFYVAAKILDDELVENTETFSIVANVLSGSVQNNQASGLVTIVDDDRLPSLSINAATSPEGGTAVFTVTLSASSTMPVSVVYETQHGTTSAEDFAAKTGTLTFTPGTTAMTVSIPILADATPEGVETFYVTLKNAVNARIAAASGVGSISANTPNQNASQLIFYVNHDISENFFYLAF